jgi:hypothetical protein
LRKAATIESVKGSLSTYSKLGMIGGIGMFLILIPGIYMAAVAWHSAGWVAVGLGGTIVIGAVGGIMTGRKMRGMKNDAAGAGDLTPEFRKRTLDNSLVLSIRMRTMLLLGIVYMMTVKPSLTGSVIILVISILLGFLPIGPRRIPEVTGKAEHEINQGLTRRQQA